jgi:SAM-dependent methyltransferase
MDRVIYERMAATQEVHWWFAGRRLIVDHLLRSLRLPPESRILEVGCGTGANIAMLRNFGSVEAVELDSFARDHVRAAMKIDVAPGSLPDDLPYADRKFDLICLFDVLEHVERDQEALCNLRERLAPNGLLIVTVPAYQWLYGSHDVQHHHYRRYTARQLRTIAQAASLRPIRVGYYNTVLFPLVLIRRLAEKLLDLHPIDDSALPGSLLNWFLYRAFSLEARFIGSWFFPVGLSVVGLFHAGEEAKQSDRFGTSIGNAAGTARASVHSNLPNSSADHRRSTTQ